MTAGTQGIQVNVDTDLGTAIIGGIKVEVSRDSNVVVYSNEGVQTKPAAPVTALTKEGVEDMQISISKNFNAVALHRARIELAADSSLIVYTNGTVKVKPAVGKLTALAAVGPANDSVAKAAPQIGDRMPDGTVFAGISPDSNKPMFATPADASLTYTFNQAQNYAAKLDGHGHKDCARRRRAS